MPPLFDKQEILCRSSLHFILINTNVVEEPADRPGILAFAGPGVAVSAWLGAVVGRCLPPDKPTEFSVENMVMVAGPQVEGGRW